MKRVVFIVLCMCMAIPLMGQTLQFVSPTGSNVGNLLTAISNENAAVTDVTFHIQMWNTSPDSEAQVDFQISNTFFTETLSVYESRDFYITVPVAFYIAMFTMKVTEYTNGTVYVICDMVSTSAGTIGNSYTASIWKDHN
ncbi:MAG: hypothetical protein LBK22_09680 [Tannerella sp.]|jgi:hypothetical protein|nr:hypothetical protein [Tannerella sp.]